MSASLLKPLRPLWVSQLSRMWGGSELSPEGLPFTPIILVSASLPNARQRMSTGAWCCALLPCGVPGCTATKSTLLGRPTIAHLEHSSVTY